MDGTPQDDLAALQAQVQALRASLDLAERHARRGRDMLDAMFVHSPVAMSITRASDGRFIDVNARWTQLLGLSRDEVMGRASSEFTEWVDAASLQRVRDAAAGRSGAAPVEVSFVRRDGQPVSVRMEGARLHLDGEPHYVAYVTDVTRERQARDAARISGEALQAVNDDLLGKLELFRLTEIGAKVGHWIWQTEASSLYWSRGMYELTGLPPRPNLTLDYARSIVHPEDLPHFVEVRDRADGEPVEFRIIRADTGEVRFWRGSMRRHQRSDGSLVDYGVIQDITEAHLTKRALQDRLNQLQALTELSSDWYWEQDANFRFVRFEGQLVHKAGKSGPQSIGKTRWEVGALNMRDEDWAGHQALLNSHAVFRDLELQDTDYKGRVYWMSLSGAPMFDALGRFTGYRGVGRNISERKRAEEKIEKLAFFDALTGLPNRRLLIDRLQYALATMGRDSTHGALLFIDLDNFKDLNDSQGHDVGDMLLQQVASRLQACVREADTVARLGGDEFVVMVQNLEGDAEQATARVEQVGRKILEQLNQAYLLGAMEHHSTPSIGVTMLEDPRQSVDELLKQADLAMYEAKAAGRNTLRFFDPAMQQFVALRTAMEQELRLGLQRDELLLYYQPVVNARGLTVGVEALVRWNHPLRGMVPPVQFIPMAEQTGLIVPLGQWVLETACRQLAAWSAWSHTAGLSMAVNVSARQFRHTDFVRDLRSVLERTGANPRNLKLELTESLLLADQEEAVRRMNELGTLGVKFSLDDFGTGYSSLSYLKVLPLEQLKIDQSFVRDVLSDANDAAIARTVLALGHSLGLNVVAEGVESTGQRDFLLVNGCTLFQGYFFGRPVPVEQLQLQLEQNRD